MSLLSNEALVSFLFLYGPLLLFGLAAAHHRHRGYLVSRILGWVTGGRVAAGGVTAWFGFGQSRPGLHLLLEETNVSLLGLKGRVSSLCMTIAHVYVSAQIVP